MPLRPGSSLLAEEIGTWGGKIQNATLPDYCEVDYVRVYEAKADQGI